MVDSSIKNKPFLKRLIIRLFKKYYDLGYFQKGILKSRVINWIFQRLLRINSEVPWSVNFTSCVIAPKNIKFGVNVWRSFILSRGCYIQGGNGIYIGDNTFLGPNVGIISANHDITKLERWQESKPIHIGKNCWIGMNSVILPGVTLGDNVIVGAGSIVTKDFPNKVLIAGNPAKIIKYIK